MVGERVMHIRFGEGTVTAFAPPHIEIAFSDGAVKNFAYPQAVDRFITFDGENAREQARRDREQADVVTREKEMAKMLADRQKAEKKLRSSAWNSFTKRRLRKRNAGQRDQLQPAHQKQQEGKKNEESSRRMFFSDITLSVEGG